MVKSLQISSSELADIRKELGHTMEQFAASIGVTKVTVARWEAGERPCRGAKAVKVRELAAAHRRKLVPFTNWSLSPHHLSRLTPLEAVTTFRDLLWSEAQLAGIGPSSVTISLEEHPDDGIDAFVPDVGDSAGSQILRDGDNYFQIKAGASAKPTHDSWMREELFGSKSKESLGRADLSAGVRRCLEHDGRYVMVFFGLDLNYKEETKVRENIIRWAEKCGFRNPRVEVWGQQKLIGCLSSYPALALKLTGRLPQFQSYESWRTNSDMAVEPLCLGAAQQTIIEKIREFLRTPNVRHIRIIGEPGVGKTRIVLEAVSEPDLAPTVVYFANAESFQQSQLFNELVGAGIECSVTLVLDECLTKDCDSIWTVLRNRSPNVRVISLDHDPYRPADPSMKVLECPPLDEQNIENIIANYVPRKLDARRWAEFCTGSPRMAHAIGNSLQQGASDLLRAISFESIVERFVAGYRRLDSTEAREKLMILRHLALFYRFGFESPVGDEAQYIFETLIKDAMPSLSWEKFQDRVMELRQQRILQGNRTLFIVPKILHVYLWTEYWQRHGRNSELNRDFVALPPTLKHWFIRMFPYAAESSVATQHVEALLLPGGPFSNRDYVFSQEGSKFFSQLAEGCPKSALGCLERIFEMTDHEDLLRFEDGRQQIVWALEMMAASGDLFQRAAALLSRLAEAENANNSNNATGTFVDLFCLNLSPTEATPDERLAVLSEYLSSHAPADRKLGLKACQKAISIHSGGRVIGAEFRGIRPTAQLWWPRTWDELHTAREAVWATLFEKSRTWSDSERKEANRVMVNAASGLLQIKHERLQKSVLQSLASLSADKTTDLIDVVDLVARARGHWKKFFTPNVVSDLEKLDRQITGKTFAGRLRRTVLLSRFDEIVARNGLESDEFGELVSRLAEEATKKRKEFNDLLPELVRGTNNPIYGFGRALGRNDPKRQLLAALLTAYRNCIDSPSVLLLSGYLATVFEKDVSAWEQVIEELLNDSKFSPIVGLIIRNSGFTECVFKTLLRNVENSTLPFDCLRAFRYSNQVRELTDEMFFAFVDCLERHGLVLDALEHVDFVFCGTEASRKLPDPERIFRLLECPTGEFKGSGDEHHWTSIATRLCETFPEKKHRVFQAALDKVCAADWFLTANDEPYQLIQSIIKSSPNECWQIICERIDSLGRRENWRILSWLSARTAFGDDELVGPLALFPVGSVMSWISEDPDNRAADMAGVVPKTLESGEFGAYAREILNRYGDRRDVRSALFSNFWCGGWCGSESAYYRRKRDSARAWLNGENSFRVRKWIEDYIDLLSKEIVEAEVMEERE